MHQFRHSLRAVSLLPLVPDEAILWHGREGTRARQRFEALSKAERESLLAFLKSL